MERTEEGFDDISMCHKCGRVNKKAIGISKFGKTELMPLCTCNI